MKAQTKSIITLGLIGGITFAIVTAGLEYLEGQNFRIWKFIFNILFFGGATSLFTFYRQKKDNG